jgi:MoxR-like ATPase
MMDSTAVLPSVGQTWLADLGPNVVPDDVKRVAVPALGHRLALRPEMWVQRVQSDDVVRECLSSVPVPAVEPGPA